MAFGTEPLRIGNVTFTDDEEPEDLPLGSHGVVINHDFEGGIRTQQEFGVFPPEGITWHGYLVGVDAVPRSQTLEQLCKDQQEIPLTWMNYSYLGKIKDYVAHNHHAYYVEYEMTFSPRIDNTTGFTGVEAANPESRITQEFDSIKKITGKGSFTFTQRPLN